MNIEKCGSKRVNLSVLFTCLRTCATNSWYFDSEYSRHMIGDKDILVNYKPLSEGLVTFGNGVTARVPDRGNFMANSVCILNLKIW